MNATVEIKSACCPRCAIAFVCKPEDIANCHCSQVSISKEEYDYMQTNFSGCLCNACIHTIKEEFQKSIIR